MPNVLAEIPVGEDPLEEWLGPLFDAVKGHPDLGIPFDLTEYEDPAKYALTVRNKDTINGLHLQVQYSDATAALEVTDGAGVVMNGAVLADAAMRVTGELICDGGLTVNAALGDISLNDNVDINGNVDIDGLLNVHVDSADYTLTIQNLDSGVGRHFKILDSSGGDLMRVRDGDVSIFTTLAVSDVATFNGDAAFNGAAAFDGNIGFFGGATASQGSVASSASDLATVITLANSLRSLVLRYNFA